MPIIGSDALVSSLVNHRRLKLFEIIEQKGGKSRQFLSIKRCKFCLCGFATLFESPGNLSVYESEGAKIGGTYFAIK
jgi:hypothetical protein